MEHFPSLNNIDENALQSPLVLLSPDKEIADYARMITKSISPESMNKEGLIEIVEERLKSIGMTTANVLALIDAYPQ